MSVTITYLDFIPIHRVDALGLVCPLSGNIEPMYLQLYQQHAENWAVSKMTKKVTGVFFQSATDTEIPARKWTREMQAFFNEQKKMAPMQPKKTTFTTRGKVFLGLVLALIIYMVYGMSAHFYNISQGEKLIAELREPPQIGDMYFGELQDTQNRNTTGYYTWVKVVDSQSGSFILKKSTDTGGKYGFQPEEVKRDSFESGTLSPVTFDQKRLIFSGSGFSFAMKNKNNNFHRMFIDHR